MTCDIDNPGRQSRRLLITGIGGPAGRASARFFHDNGFEVHGTDIIPVQSDAEYFTRVPRGDDPTFPEAILEIVRHDAPLLFLCTVTEEIPAAAVLKKALRGMGVAVFCTDPLMATIANDKYLTARYLFGNGIAVPRTLNDLQCASAAEAGDQLGYPFIVKPRQGRGGRGVNLVVNAAAAENESRSNVAYQEFVGGEEYDVNLFAYPAGTPVHTQVLLKTGLKDGTIGNATGVRSVYHPEVEFLAIETARAMCLEGPIDMDIRLTEGGMPKVLEVNARVGANVLAARQVLHRMLEYSIAGVHP